LGYWSKGLERRVDNGRPDPDPCQLCASGQDDLIDMTSILAGLMYEQGVKLKVFGAGVGRLGAVMGAADSDARQSPIYVAVQLLVSPAAQRHRTSTRQFVRSTDSTSWRTPGSSRAVPRPI
jgi:hypothetical protein